MLQNELSIVFFCLFIIFLYSLQYGIRKRKKKENVLRVEP